MNEFQTLIKEICDKNEIKMDIISRGWIIALNKDNIHRFIVGCKFDNNSHGLGLALDDKYATYEVLNYAGLPVIPHEIIYSVKNKNSFAIGANSYEYVYDYFEKCNHNIVIKVNDGAQGKNCYHVTNKKEIKKILKKLFKRHFSLSMQPYMEIRNEYRIIMLDKEIMLMYKKIKPVVTGDGKKSIRELLREFNPHFFEGKLKNKKYNQILQKGEVFAYNWQFNLSSGAIMSEEISSDLKEKLEKIVLDVVNKLDLNFVSVDIIDTPNGLMVLEINSGVAMAHYRKIAPCGYEKSKMIYEKAVLKMFEK